MRPLSRYATAAMIAWTVAISVRAENPRDGEEKPAPRRPNILFAVADDASYPYMGAYGCRWTKTPAFDRVAREGILFSHAYTPNAKCAPSRASILTGRNSWQLEAAANHWCYFPDKFKVYTEVLAEHGYRVGMTGKGWAPGVARDRDGKPRHLAGRPVQAAKTNPPATGIANNDYAANFAAFLDQAAARRDTAGQAAASETDANAPWCFWYGGYEPHRGYEFGAGIRKGGKQLADIDRVPPFWPDNAAVRTDMLDYAYELEYFDQHLARMLSLLEERGELANTLVVVTADNGMPFPRVKGQKYEPSNHLPLAIMWPAGIAMPGRTVDDYVSFIDFAPTFLEVAGVDAKTCGMAEIAGRSLVGIFQSERSGIVDATRDHVLIGKERHDIGRPGDVGYPVRGIVKGDKLYLKNFEPTRWPAGNPEAGYLNCDGSPTKTEILRGHRAGEDTPFWQWAFGRRPDEELYDLGDDPACVKNLAEDKRHAATLAALREQMLAELKAQQDPRMFGSGDIFDRYPYADEAMRGYYDRYLRGERVPRAGWVNESDYETKPPQ